jgi:hypothetical protein
MQNTETNMSGRAYACSIAFHAVLMLWMLNMRFSFTVEPPAFFQISLGAVSSQRIEQIMEESVQRQAMTPEERIDVPDRRMIDIDEPTISVPSQNRIESKDIVSTAAKLKTEIDPQRVDSPVRPSEILSMDRKVNYQGSRISVGEQPGAGIETSVIGASEAINFTIEGEVQGRKVLSNPLPQYPEGLNKTATIRISFAVQPDGAVSASGMVPVRKENAVLEELAMNSLKLWRFSPLPEGSSATQRGIITFVFSLKQQ